MEKERYAAVRHALCERVESMGYECAGIELVSEAGIDVLRVYLEMPGGVDTGDCEKVSRGLSSYLDDIEDELPEHYLLEVSSPGAERVLFSAGDYRRFAGSTARICLKGREGCVEGVIAGVTPEDEVLIDTGDGELKIAACDIKRGNLVCMPEKGQKKTFRKVPKKKK